MRTTCLLLLFVFPILLLGQQAYPANQAPAAPNPYEAPKPGHPLNANDVDVLTGKTSLERQHPAPPLYYSGYGDSFSLLSNQGTISRSTLPFSALFGQVGGKRFDVFGINTPTLGFVPAPFVPFSSPIFGVPGNPLLFNPRFSPGSVFRGSK